MGKPVTALRSLVIIAVALSIFGINDWAIGKGLVGDFSGLNEHVLAFPSPGLAEQSADEQVTCDAAVRRYVWRAPPPGGGYYLVFPKHHPDEPVTIRQLLVNGRVVAAEPIKQQWHRAIFFVSGHAFDVGENLIEVQFADAPMAAAMDWMEVRNYRRIVDGVWLVARGMKTGRSADTSQQRLATLLSLSLVACFLVLGRRALVVQSWAEGLLAGVIVFAHFGVPVTLWIVERHACRLVYTLEGLWTTALATSLTPAIGLAFVRMCLGRWFVLSVRGWAEAVRQVRRAIVTGADAVLDLCQRRWLVGASVTAACCILPDLLLFAWGRSPLTADTLTSNLPLKALAIEQWRQSRVPLWTSRLGCGYPLWADSIALPLDVRNAWFFVAPVTVAYWLSIATSRCLGAAVAYGYFRVRLQFSHLASMTATWVYFFGTVFLSESRLHSTAPALDWLPGVIWLTERLVERVSVWRLASLAMAWATLLYSSSVAYLVYLPPWALVWGLGIGWLKSTQHRARALALFVAAYCVALLWGLALAAVFVVPFAELTSLSNRGGEYPEDPFALRSLWYAVFGSHVSSNYIPEFNFFFYVGVIAIPFIVAGALKPKNAQIRLARWLAPVTVIILALLTSPFKPLLCQYVPLLATFSFFRLSFYWGFLAAILCGAGIDRSTMAADDFIMMWMQRTGKLLGHVQLSALVGIIMLVVVAAILYFEVSPFQGRTLAAMLGLGASFYILVLLRLAGLQILSSKPPPAGVQWACLLLALELAAVFTLVRDQRSIHRGHFPRTPEVDFLLTRSSPESRVFQVMPVGWAGDHLQHDEGLISLYLDAQAIWGLYTASLYESLIPKSYSEFLDLIGDKDLRTHLFPRAPNAVMTTTKHDSPLIDLLAVKYIISTGKLEEDEGLQLICTGSNYYVYALKSAFPRAFYVSQARIIAPDDMRREIRKIAQSYVPVAILKKEVWVDAETCHFSDSSKVPPAIAASPSEVGQVISDPMTDFEGTAGEAIILADRDREVVVSVRAPRAGYLVLCDTFYPGWKCVVGDREVPIFRVNGYARGVALPAGEHIVRFVYEPMSFYAGLWITLVTSTVTAVVLVVVWLKNRAAQGTGAERTTRRVEVARPAA